MSELDLQDELTAIIGTAEPSDLDPRVDWAFLQANMQHRKYRDSVNQAIYAARDAGRMLLKAKAEYQRLHGKRGGWTDILKAHFEGSVRTAYNHMQIAQPENWEKIEAYLQRLQLSEKEEQFGVRDALALLAPAEEAEVVEGELVEEPSPPAPLPEGEGSQEPETAKCPQLSNPNPNDEYYTPTHIVERVVAVLGELHLDPCCNPGKAVVPARQHFRREDNGLERPWGDGPFYCNPPYSGGALKPWSEKIIATVRDGPEGIVLVPAYTAEGWWATLMQEMPMVCFLHGRLTFLGQNSAARFASAVLYFGSSPEVFWREFAGLGTVMQELTREAFGS